LAGQRGRVCRITDPIRRQELDGAPSSRRARTAAAVRSEAWGKAAAVPGAAALLWARVWEPSVFANLWMQAISSPKGFMTAARQLSRQFLGRRRWRQLATPRGCGKCDAGEDEKGRQGIKCLVPLQGLQQAGQCPDARAECRDRDPAQCGDACPRTCTRSKPAGRGPASGDTPVLGRWCYPGPVPPVPPWASRPRAPRFCGDISWQVRHTRRHWPSIQASGGAEPVDRCTERRWETSDCRQAHPVGEAP